MNIPPLDQRVLADPDFLQARESLAQSVRKMPRTYLGEELDEENGILIDQCEAWNVFPRLRSREQGAQVGQLILELRGHINTDTKRLLSYFEDEKEDPENIFSCKLPISLHYSIVAMHSLGETRQKAVYDVAFAQRNKHLHLQHALLMNDENAAAATTIAFRAQRLERAYKEIMGAMPKLHPSV